MRQQGDLGSHKPSNFEVQLSDIAESHRHISSLKLKFLIDSLFELSVLFFCSRPLKHVRVPPGAILWLSFPQISRLLYRGKYHIGHGKRHFLSKFILFPSPAESRLILGMDEELPRSGVP